MVEVFKTNVQNRIQAKQVIDLLKAAFSDAQINFDLHDCDKVLRVEGINSTYCQTIVSDLASMGFKCEILN